MAEYSDDLAGTRQAIKALAKNVGTALAAIPTGGGSSALGNTVSVLQAADFSWPARPDSVTVFAIGAKNRTNDPPGWLTENDVYVEA